MSKNKYLIAANWKQNCDSKSSTKLINDFVKLFNKTKPKCDVLILPPSIYLDTILTRLNMLKVSLKKISLGIQNISPFLNGAYTGEISVDMAKDFKCSYSLIGHSERRHVFMESDKIISAKTKSNQDKIIIAYEPVWAIGSGKTASLDDIADVHAYIRNTLNKILGTKKNTIKILYGGSVNDLNAASILKIPDVNGALVGGASLNSKKFIDICSSI